MLLSTLQMRQRRGAPGRYTFDSLYLHREVIEDAARYSFLARLTETPWWVTLKMSAFCGRHALFQSVFVLLMEPPLVAGKTNRNARMRGYATIFVVTAQRGARTHDPEIKSLMLYRLS